MNYSFLELSGESGQKSTMSLMHEPQSEVDPSNPPPFEPSEKILFSKFMKRGEKFAEFHERHLLLTKNFLYIFEDAEKSIYLGRYKLGMMGSSYFQDEVTSNKKYGLTFTRDLISVDFITKVEETFKKWQKELAKLCIQTDFHSKYKTMSQLGQGKFAEVYKVRNHETGEIFAAKALLKSALDDKKFACVVNELKLMQQLDHKYLVKMHEVHETKNTFYWIMDYLEGGELFETISRVGALTLVEACRFMKQMFEG
jgi:hypothetical protein